MTSAPPGQIPDARIDLASPDAEGAKIISRVVWRLIPFLCLLYIVNYLDRNNVAMAKLRMLPDTGLDDAIYGRGTGMFFLGYFLFEFPSNLILERVGARRWLARIMISWGIISAAMMFVTGARSFYTLRFLLGLAEAGFFPGIVLYLSYWIPSRHRAGVLAAFLTSTAVSGVVGNPLAGLLMKMDGIGNLHGWQWLFLIEGLLPVVLGFVTLRLLPDRPAQARWLAPEQRDWIEAELARERAQSHDHVAELRRALKDLRLWLLCAIYFLLIMGLYGFIYWVPTILKGVSGASDLNVGLLSAVPYLVAAISMVIIGKHADHRNERRWHVSGTALIAAIGIVVLTLCHTTPLVLASLCLAGIGIWGCLGPFWALSTRFLRGTAAAGGIAIVNSIGNLAGFVSSSVIGSAVKSTGSVAAGMLVVAISLLFGAILVMCVPRAIDREPSL